MNTSFLGASGGSPSSAYSGLPAVRDRNSDQRRQSSGDRRRMSDGNRVKAVKASVDRPDFDSTILEPGMVKPCLELVEEEISEQPDLAQATHRTRERKAGKVLLRQKPLENN